MSERRHCLRPLLCELMSDGQTCTSRAAARPVAMSSSERCPDSTIQLFKPADKGARPSAVHARAAHTIRARSRRLQCRDLEVASTHTRNGSDTPGAGTQPGLHLSRACCPAGISFLRRAQSPWLCTVLRLHKPRQAEFAVRPARCLTACFPVLKGHSHAA